MHMAVPMNSSGNPMNAQKNKRGGPEFVDIDTKKLPTPTKVNSPPTMRVSTPPTRKNLRTPLCFGFLTRQYAANAQFAEGDHRRRWSAEQRKLWDDAGKAFNAAVSPLPGQTSAQTALRFCLSYPGVSTTIPGMLTVAHVDDNSAASALGPMPADERTRLEKLYEEQQFFLAPQRPAQHNVRP